MIKLRRTCRYIVELDVHVLCDSLITVIGTQCKDFETSCSSSVSSSSAWSEALMHHSVRRAKPLNRLDLEKVCHYPHLDPHAPILVSPVACAWAM